MTKAPDLEALARRYFDLWQQEMAAMAGDPRLPQAMGRAWEMMSRNLAGGFAAAGKDAHAPTATPAGPAPAAVSPDGAGGGADDLARRVAELEERVRLLEAQLSRPRRRGKGAGGSAG